MKKLKNEIFTFLIIGVCFGFVSSMYSWDGIVHFIENKSGRIPAENHNFNPFKNIQQKTYNSSYKKDILENIIVENNSTNTIYKIKNLYTKSNENVCNKFSKLKVTFTAINMSVSGESPYLTIETDCKIGKKNYLSEVRFPKEALKQFNLSKNTLIIGNQTVKLVNIYDEIPAQFQITEVLFHNPRGQASFSSLKIPMNSSKNNLIVEL